MLALITSTLALQLPSGITRRQAIVGASGLAAGVVPTSALALRPVTGINLLRETFAGTLPAGGLLEWYSEHLSTDFIADFGPVKLNKEEYLVVTADILKSFPDFTYTNPEGYGYGFAYAESPKIVTWTAVVQGTHTGAPYSPLPGVPAVNPKTPPVFCQNDAEKITASG